MPGARFLSASIADGRRRIPEYRIAGYAMLLDQRLPRLPSEQDLFARFGEGTAKTRDQARKMSVLQLWWRILFPKKKRRLLPGGEWFKWPPPLNPPPPPRSTRIIGENPPAPPIEFRPAGSSRIAHLCRRLRYDHALLVVIRADYPIFRDLRRTSIPTCESEELGDR